MKHVRGSPTMLIAFLLASSHFQVVEGSLVELFNRLPWDEEGAAWELEADLKELIIYVRGSKKLRIPSEWRCAIPTAI